MKRLLLLVVAVAAAGATYGYIFTRQVAGPLSGEPVSRAVASRRAVAVILDNYTPGARPQAGLRQASLVFETLAEGGITRFMAVYQEHDAPVVGPIRSTRLYFNSWVAGLDAIFGHDGGNVDALRQLPSLSTVFNVDADRSAGPFYRVSDRTAPHNEYTSTQALRAYASSHGGATTGPPPSLPHKDDAPPRRRPTNFSLAIDFSGPDYNVTWQYDRLRNLYLRSMGGAPHLDAATNAQLTAKNVVVMWTTVTAAYDPFTPGAIHLGTLGSGKAVVYEDGAMITGTWHKDSPAAPLQWLDRTGSPIPLDRGNTWVEIVPEGTVVAPS